MPPLQPFIPVILCAFLIAGLLTPSRATAEHANSLVVRYPVVKDAYLYKTQSRYFLELIALALENSGVTYKLEYVNVPSLPQSRSAKLIGQKIYDVHWMNTNSERENTLMPVRIPLLRGLLGLRIGLVRQDNLQRCQAVKNKTDLQGIRIGQGHDWTDTQVLLANNIRVAQAVSTDALYDMLLKGRIDYFPRSVIEINSELQIAGYPNIMTDPYIALYYPQAVYFFTHADNVQLNRAIARGLGIAMDNGQFDALFQAYYADALDKARLDQRRIIRLTNRTLPPETPLQIKKYWYAEKILSSQAENAD